MGNRMFYSMALGVALTALLVIAGCNRSISPQEEIAVATEKEQAGDLRAAYLHVKTAVQADPAYAEGRWVLGRLQVRAGMGPSAEKELLRGLKLGSTPPDALEWVTRAFLLQAKYEAVIEGEPARLIAKSFSLTEPSPRMRAVELALVGHAHAHLNAMDAAVSKYQEALALAPESGEALYGLGAVAAQASRDEEARSWLERALQAEPRLANAWTTLGDLEFREQHFEAAAAAFGKAADLRLDNDSDLFMRFFAKLSIPNYKAAKTELQALQKTGSRPAWKSYAQGLLAFHQKEYPAARDALRAAVASAPDFLAALAYLGYTEFLLGNLEQARTHFGAVYAKSPSDHQLAVSLAAIELRLKNYARAGELAAKALAIEPNNTLAMDVLGSAALATGNHDLALQQFDALAAKDPKSWTALAKLGSSHLEAGNLDKGFADLEAAVNLASDRVPLRAALVQAYMQAGRIDAAIKIAQQMQVDSPEISVGWMLEGGAHLAKQDVHAASKIFTTALAKFPGDPSAALSLAAIASTRQDYKEVRRLYEQILKAHPGHRVAELKLADLDLAENKLPEAIAGAQKILDRKADDPAATLILAKAYAAQGALRKTIELLEKPAQAEPGSISAALLGEALLANGDVEQAIPILAKVANENPASAEARYVLAKAYATGKDAPRALETLQETLELKPQGSTAVGIVRLFASLGDIPSAQEALDPIRMFLKEQPVLIELDSLIALGEGNSAKAEKMLAEGYRRFPKDRGIVLLLASARKQAQNPVAGLNVVSTWLDANPDDTDARVVRADLLSSLERTDEAIAEYKLIAEKEPEDAYVLNNLAWLLRDSEPAQAISWAEKAAQVAPNSPAVLDTLGSLVLAEGDDIGRAVEVLKKANELAPKITEIQVHLAEAYLKKGEPAKAKNLLVAVLSVESTGANATRANQLLSSIK